MMNLEELVDLFKKHDYWTVSLFLFVIACASLIVGIVFADWSAIFNVLWCGVGIYSNYVICKEKEAHEATKGKLADTQDDLCIYKHEVERLALELETYKSM